MPGRSTPISASPPRTVRLRRYTSLPRAPSTNIRRLRAERLRARPCASAYPGTPIGRTDAGRQVTVPDAVRAQGLYITGATGTGKSTLLAHMIRHDLDAGCGICVIDLHGDLFDEIAVGLDPATMKRAMIADLSEGAAPFTLNLLEPEGRAPERHRNFVCNQLIGAFKRLYRDVPEGFGPMFEAYFRNALLLLMEAEGAEAMLLDLDRVFTDAKWRREALERCTDPNVHHFWRGIATRAGGEAALENIAPYIVSKLTQFTANPALRPVLCAPRSSPDFAAAMTEGRPCLVNLAKGAVGEADAALMGALVTAKLFGAALQRAALPRDTRRPFRLYLDEFHGYSMFGSTKAYRLTDAETRGASMRRPGACPAGPAHLDCSPPSPSAKRIRAPPDASALGGRDGAARRRSVDERLRRRATDMRSGLRRAARDRPWSRSVVFGAAAAVGRGADPGRRARRAALEAPVSVSRIVSG